MPLSYETNSILQKVAGSHVAFFCRVGSRAKCDLIKPSVKRKQRLNLVG
jgi:hypothetical protein